MRKYLKQITGLAFSLIFTSAAQAVPVSLEGMGKITEWTDYEFVSGDMPDYIWGSSDVLGADRIGLYVEFANGLSGYATYSNVASLWNTSNFAGIAADTATGFFTAANGMHFLYNTPATTTYPQALPIAWESFVMPFSNNFDLDYNDPYNGIQSNFRANAGGWEFAMFATYSSAYADVPESATLALLGISMAGFVMVRRRRCNKNISS